MGDALDLGQVDVLVHVYATIPYNLLSICLLYVCALSFNISQHIDQYIIVLINLYLIILKSSRSLLLYPSSS